jgi:hypothetical protein
MSKVVHLSDDAHNKAKAFCKQHSLKMSDWVAALIEEAIATGRTDPTIKVRAVAPPPPPPPPAPVAAPQTVTISAPAPLATSSNHGNGHGSSHSSNNHSNKKRLERYDERVVASPDQGMPPWAAPPFWAHHKAQTK